MASFPKRFALPRLHLLVLVLILGTGLLPKNSLAQDEPASDADPAAPASGDGASASDSSAGGSGSGSEKASARADAKRTSCWMDECRTPPDDCSLKPSDRGGKAKEQPECGHGCFSGVQTGDKPFFVRRACATELEEKCIKQFAKKDGPPACFMNDLNNEADYKKCVEQTISLNDSSTIVEICLCDTPSCNDKTSSGPVGAKHLGFNVVLVGALLVVAVLPLLLQKVFLVG